MPPSLAAIGSSCLESSECSTNYCFFFPVFGEPGVCTCHIETDVGCSSGTTCTEDPYPEDRPPICAVAIDGDCGSDSECVTEFCSPDSGQCSCNPFVNVGCPGGERCVGDETMGSRCEAITKPPLEQPGDEATGTPSSMPTTPSPTLTTPETSLCYAVLDCNTTSFSCGDANSKPANSALSYGDADSNRVTFFSYFAGANSKPADAHHSICDPTHSSLLISQPHHCRQQR